MNYTIIIDEDCSGRSGYCYAACGVPVTVERATIEALNRDGIAYRIIHCHAPTLNTDVVPTDLSSYEKGVGRGFPVVTK